ncbi:hypothetical protein ACWEKT_36320 [Nocardia takedensis]
MKNLVRGALLTAAATGLVLGASSTATADTSTGSAGWFGDPVCLLKSLLTYGTISADAGPTIPQGCTLP